MLNLTEIILDSLEEIQKNKISGVTIPANEFGNSHTIIIQRNKQGHITAKRDLKEVC